MKRNLLFGTIAMMACSLLAADSKQEVAAAAKKLTAASNYSWKSTVDLGPNANFTPGPTEGKSEKDGLTWISSSFGDTASEGVKKGEKVAVKTDAGWQTADEAAGGEGFNPGGFMARRLQTTKAPAIEVEELLAGVTTLTKEGDVYSGQLGEEHARTALASGFGGRRGGQPPTVSNAKGTVKFWLKDGALAKYETKVTGKRTNQNGDEVDVDRTTTTEIKDVGTTKLEVPEEAKKKLS